MTLAVSDVLCKWKKGEVIDKNEFSQTLIASMREFGRRYPYAGCGGRFFQWLSSDDPQPYNSWGNGSAMRVSPVAMWNLIFIGGTWRGVDVTWDDTGNDIVYNYFNVGLDVMRASYSFYDIVIPVNVAEETNPIERPVHEYHVSSEEEITSACMDMIYSGKERITLRCSERFFRKFTKNKEVLSRAVFSAGIQRYESIYRNNVIILSKIVLAEAETHYEFTGEVSVSGYSQNRRKNESRSLLSRILESVKKLIKS